MTTPLAKSDERVPVLEIGGTHVVAAWASSAGAVEVVSRQSLHNMAPADDLARVITDAGRQLGAPEGAVWGAAIPGPFDYDRGIGDFTGVPKFDHWHGHDVGADLRAGLGAGAIHFLNDADAFGVGEAMAGATQGLHRSIGLTLGTGIGSAFVVDGVPVVTGPGIPRLGEVHTLHHGGRSLEELVSRGAIREAWREATGEWVEVKPIAEAALAGDEVALTIFDDAYRVLAEVIEPVVHEFGAEGLVMGGSIARSTELVDRFFTARMHFADGSPVPVWFSPDAERSAIVGAAHWARAAEAGARYR